MARQVEAEHLGLFGDGHKAGQEFTHGLLL
jgi:hypothetical protein